MNPQNARHKRQKPRKFNYGHRNGHLNGQINRQCQGRLPALAFLTLMSLPSRTFHYRRFNTTHRNWSRVQTIELLPRVHDYYKCECKRTNPINSLVHVQSWWMVLTADIERNAKFHSIDTECFIWIDLNFLSIKSIFCLMRLQPLLPPSPNGPTFYDDCACCCHVWGWLVIA